MNTPPARIAWDHETIHRPETLGRVVNGVVVWPQAAMRLRLGLPAYDTSGGAAEAAATLAIAATGQLRKSPVEPVASRLDAAFEIDKEGFLVPPDATAPSAV